MKIRSTATFILVAAFTLTLALSAYGQEDKESESVRTLPGTNPHALIGTWTASSVITNCAGVTLFSHTKLVSFTDSGTAVETSTSPLRTAALGIWDHAGQHTFRYMLNFYRYNADNTLAGSTRAIWTVTMNTFNDGYTAEAAVQMIAPNGNVVANLCGAETGTRMRFPDPAP